MAPAMTTWQDQQRAGCIVNWKAAAMAAAAAPSQATLTQQMAMLLLQPMFSLTSMPRLRRVPMAQLWLLGQLEQPALAPHGRLLPSQ